MFKYLGHKTKKLEIWYENERVRDILTSMLYSNAVIEAFRHSKKTQKRIINIF